MTITIDIRPEVEAELARRASMRGRPVEAYAATLLEEAVAKHLVADVPVGVFLSSGLDSTALAAIAASERQGVHTFTVVFPEQAFSEAPLARATAARLGTEHSELLVTSEEMQSRLLEAVGALDQAV